MTGPGRGMVAHFKVNRRLGPSRCGKSLVLRTWLQPPLLQVYLLQCLFGLFAVWYDAAHGNRYVHC